LRSLQTTQLLIWASEAFIFFLPYSKIEEHLPPKPEQKIQSQNQWFLHWRNQMLRFYPLTELLDSNLLSTAENKATFGTGLTLVIRQNQQFIALEAAIKHLITKPEIVPQPPSDSVRLPAYLPGYTQLENNELVPVIDVEVLVQTVFSCKD
jgi:chemotaxis protein histidine kinase CheA